ncbi:hypothetical protein MAMMFC1_01389 [Methylomusa anaerophila]|uniref:Uncharacterized protein n=1 Tax=Methylomusa anaerophila TaxID=1930071 RepID=A0A348AI30_9FIRM|nr:hypothetical protein MAMMFC1_01389 [Methylomusa anaerophila]
MTSRKVSASLIKFIAASRASGILPLYFFFASLKLVHIFSSFLSLYSIIINKESPFPGYFKYSTARNFLQLFFTFSVKKYS